VNTCRSALALLALLALACEGEDTTAGVGEPVRVYDNQRQQSAQFQAGPLPGIPPLTSDEVNAGVKPISPNVTVADTTGRSIRPGQSDKHVFGRASQDALSVGIAFEGLGSGYWVFPVGASNAQYDGEFEWDSLLSFADDIAPGNHRLLFAGIDPSGASGNQLELRLCVLPPIPDNANACDPKTAPPAVVVSLDWDRDVDLDLQVRAPNGKLIEAKTPSSAIGVDGAKPDPKAPGVGVLESDSNAGCAVDGQRRENVIWQTKPIPGTYAVYANLFEACAQSSVRFNLTLYQSVPGDEPDTFRQVESFRQSGTLIAAQANGGVKSGLFITEFNIN
jgi:hypothetical protein